jgi:flagellar hook-length control protein FliK
LPVKAETSSITLARKPASAALPLGADQIAKSAPDGTSGAQNPQVGAGQQAAQPPVLPPQQLPPAPVQTGDGTGLPGPVAVPPAISPPAAAAVAQSVHVAPQDTATPNFNSLAVEIVAKTQSGAKQFDIRLDPQELGRVEVRLSIDASGKAEAHLSADQPATLDLLQKDAPTLTRALRDAGLDVSQNGLNFSLRGQGGNNGNSGTNGGQSGRRSSVTSLQALKSIDAGAATAAWRGPADGRLDISV